MKILSALCVMLCIPATISMTPGAPGSQVSQPYANPATTLVAASGPGTPSTAQTGTQQQQYSPGTQQYSPGTQQYSPGTQQYSPGTQQYSPGTQQYSPGTQQYSPGTQQQHGHTPQQQRYAYVPQYGVQQATYPTYYNTPQYPNPYQQFQQTYSDYNQVYTQPQYYNPRPVYSYPPRRQVSQQNIYNDPTTALMVLESGNDMMANVYGMQKWGLPLNALDLNMDALILGDLIAPRSAGRSAGRQRSRSNAPFSTSSPLNFFALANAFQ